LKLLQTTQGSLLEDEKAIEILSECKKVSEEVEEKLTRAKSVQANLSGIVEIYDPVAKHGATLFFVVADLNSIDPMYEFSLQWFSGLYLKAVRDSEKSKNIPIRVERLIQSLRRLLFGSICASLYESDKLLFVLLMAARLMSNEGTLAQVEWRYLVMELGGTAEIAPSGVEQTIWE
jgi:dynein heavy chain